MSRIKELYMRLQEHPAYLEGWDGYRTRTSNPYRFDPAHPHRFKDTETAEAWNLGFQDAQIDQEAP